MNMDSKSVLIIGGNGYIGSRLMYELSAEYDITSIDIGWYGLESNISIDYRDLTSTWLSKFEFVILLAGHSSVNMCNGELSASWQNNVNNFIDLIGKLTNDQVLIYASTGSVYNSLSKLNNEESTLRLNPANNYDLTKYVLDINAQNFIHAGKKIIGFRFGTVNRWSPHIRDDLMINSMVKRSIDSGNINLNNLTIMRPILGIYDIIRAVDAVIKDPKPGIYNLASFCNTVEHIGNSVANILSSTIHLLPDTSGTYNFEMDTTKFQKIYKFEFKETLESIVLELIDNSKMTRFSNRNQFINYV